MNSKKRVIMLSLIAVILASGVMLSGGINKPESNQAIAAPTQTKTPTPMKEEPAPVSKSILMQAKIVMYSQEGCSHCKHAKEYIEAHYPNVEVEVVDIASDENYKRFTASVKARRIRSAGTPLILLGQEDYLIGWSTESEKKFQEYVDKLYK